MNRASGYIVILIAGVAAAWLYQWDKANANLPGARKRQPKNPRIPRPSTPAPSGSAIAGAVQVNQAGQAGTMPVLDPDSDLGVSPNSSPQTEAAYNVGPNTMSEAFGPGGNQNDEDGLERLFSF
jgi:hypothetical protein